MIAFSTQTAVAKRLCEESVAGLIELRHKAVVSEDQQTASLINEIIQERREEEERRERREIRELERLKLNSNARTFKWESEQVGLLPPNPDALTHTPPLAGVASMCLDESSPRSLYTSLKADSVLRTNSNFRPQRLLDISKSPLLDRVDAGLEVIRSWKQRSDLFSGVDAVQRTNLTVVPSSSGNGKSRFLQMLVDPCSESGDGVLKKQLINEALDEHHHLRQKLLSAIGIGVTFNTSITSLASAEISFSVAHKLAARIFFSYFVDPAKMSFEAFCSRCAAMPKLGNTSSGSAPWLEISSVVSLVLEEIDEAFPGEHRNVILAVDETLLVLRDCMQEGDQRQAELRLLGSCLGALLDSEPRVHLVVSSLNFSLISMPLTMSQRAVDCVILPPLSKSSVRAIVNKHHGSGTLSEFVIAIIVDVVRHPRLLLSILDLFARANPPTLEAALNSISESVSVVKKSEQGLMQSHVHQLDLLASLAVCFGGGVHVDRVRRDSCEQSGWILFAHEGTIFQVLVAWALSRQLGRQAAATLPVSVVAGLRHVGAFMNVERSGGKEFEEQFLQMWQLRCFSQCIVPGTVTLTGSVSMSLKAFMQRHCDDKALAVPIILEAPRQAPLRSFLSCGTTPKRRQTCSYDVEVVFPANWKTVSVRPGEWSSLSLEPGTNYVAVSDSNQGFEGFYSLAIAAGTGADDIMVMPYELKWSSASSGTKLDNSTLNDKFSKALRHEFGSRLSTLLKKGRACFLFASNRKATEHLGETDEAKVSGTSKVVLAERAAGCACILVAEAMDAFFTDSLVHRVRMR